MVTNVDSGSERVKELKKNVFDHKGVAFACDYRS